MRPAFQSIDCFKHETGSIIGKLTFSTVNPEKFLAYNSSLWSGERSKFLILEYCETCLFAWSSLNARSMKPTLMIFFHVYFSTHNMSDVNSQLKLKVNPLFEKPRRPNLNGFDVNSPYSFSLHSKSIINARTSILESPGLTNKAKRPRRQILLLNTVSELKNNFPCLKALSTVTCTQYCKNRCRSRHNIIRILS